MKLYSNTRPSQGVAYRPWAERVKELLDQYNLELPPNDEFHQYYWNDLSYEEVLNKVQFKNLKSVWMVLHVKHEEGEYSHTFRTATQAKEFFKRFPELRKKLDEL